MGEYATLPATGEEIKIGTCEDMLYLRFDQRTAVRRLPGSLDPADPQTLPHIRFRFPWPDEDQTPPGAFSDPFRRLALHVPSPEGVEHGIVQFVASREGYNVCLPCPEAPTAEPHPYTVHRNGFPGPTFLVQQAVRNGRLVIICECVCGRRYNLPTLPDAEPYIQDVLDKAEQALHPYDRPDTQRADFLTEIARRMREGYNTDANGNTVPAAAALEDATP